MLFSVEQFNTEKISAFGKFKRQHDAHVSKKKLCLNCGQEEPCECSKGDFEFMNEEELMNLGKDEMNTERSSSSKMRGPNIQPGAAKVLHEIALSRIGRTDSHKRQSTTPLQ